MSPVPPTNPAPINAASTRPEPAGACESLGAFSTEPKENPPTLPRQTPPVQQVSGQQVPGPQAPRQPTGPSAEPAFVLPPAQPPRIIPPQPQAPQISPEPATAPPARKRRPHALVAAATFALGGVVGAGGFGLGQYLANDSTVTASPVVNVAAPAVEDAPSAVPIPNAGPATAEPVTNAASIISPSVVQVETNRGQGSGVVYADGLILTNHHVIDGASQVQVRSSDGRVFETEVLGSDPRNDIAVLSAAGSNLPVATIGSSADLQVGQLTVAIGSPFRLQQTVTAGVVSSVNRPVPNAGGGTSAMIQTDAPINPGNSGGALANRNGELVGINASIRTDGTSNSNVGIGFAIPIDTAVQVAERIVTGQSLQPGVLGVTGERQDSDIGVPIAEVTPGSGADNSGIQAGDRVLTVDGAPVTSIGELTGLIQSKFSGDTVELEVSRNNSNLTLQAVLS